MYEPIYIWVSPNDLAGLVVSVINCEAFIVGFHFFCCPIT
ncbi:hypothetical protein bcere0022_23340 [Bacillus cereus Rock3-44]|nr:hypothetical protein bcere0022_23340 [Bacillus cereus Rock3-44]